MSKNDDKFSRADALALVRYARSIASDMGSNILKNRDDSEKFDEVNLRLFRRYAKLLAFPEIVVDELPPVKYREGPMTTEDRELFYWLLGNYSRRVMSLSDEKLIEETNRMLRDYK